MAWDQDLIFTNILIFCLFSDFPFCYFQLTSSDYRGLSIQHKGFSIWIAQIIKNLCEHLLGFVTSYLFKGETKEGTYWGKWNRWIFLKNGNLTFVNNCSVYVSKKKWYFLKPTQENIPLIRQLLYVSQLVLVQPCSTKKKFNVIFRNYFLQTEK